MNPDYRHIFKAYDIRGVVGKDFGSRETRAIAAAYGDFLCPDRAGRFLIGHDTRLTSPALAEAVSVGLREQGHEVVEIGLATTPMVYWYGAEELFDGSITVTASHLHPEFNGLKLCERDAKPLSSLHGLPEIAAALEQAPPAPPRRPVCHVIERRAPLAHYAARLRHRLRPTRPLKIAVDAGNGAGCVDTQSVFSPFDPVRLTLLGFHPDGSFPNRPSNPLEEGALDRLAETVTARGLDFGIAFDGDADRAVAVDERGATVPADALGGLIALHLLEEHPGATILHDLLVSRSMPETIANAGGIPIRTRVGHSFIKAAMREHDAVFAAELSGHYYYADLHYTDNGLRTLVELVNLVAAGNQPLSEMTAPFLVYPTSGEINRKVPDRARALEALETAHHDGKRDHLDGLSVDFPDWWFNARPSQTEPVLRLNIGATTPERLDDARANLLAELDRIVAQTGSVHDNH